MNSFLWCVSEHVDSPSIEHEKLERWLVAVAKSHGMLIGDVNYTFCSDDEILATNREFLNHDYYTDIITFDRSTRGVVRGDIIISLDTVKSNACSLSQDFKKELMRVIVHGVLHLCGIDDKGPGQREVMEAAEDAALAMLNE